MRIKLPWKPRLTQSPGTPEITEEALNEYQARRAEALAAENIFLRQQSGRKKTFEIGSDEDPVIRSWLVKAKESEARAAFYEPLIDLDYDFELRHKQHLETARQLPLIAAERRAVLGELTAAREALTEARAAGQKEEREAFSAEEVCPLWSRRKNESVYRKEHSAKNSTRKKSEPRSQRSDRYRRQPSQAQKERFLSKPSRPQKSKLGFGF